MLGPVLLKNWDLRSGRLANGHDPPADGARCPPAGSWLLPPTTTYNLLPGCSFQPALDLLSLVQFPQNAGTHRCWCPAEMPRAIVRAGAAPHRGVLVLANIIMHRHTGPRSSGRREKDIVKQQDPPRASHHHQRMSSGAMGGRRCLRRRIRFSQRGSRLPLRRRGAYTGRRKTRSR